MPLIRQQCADAPDQTTVCRWSLSGNRVQMPLIRWQCADDPDHLSACRWPWSVIRNQVPGTIGQMTLIRRSNDHDLWTVCRWPRWPWCFTLLEFSGSLLSVPKDTPPPPPEGRYIIELGGLGQVFTTRESGLDFSPSSIRWGGGVLYTWVRGWHSTPSPTEH